MINKDRNTIKMISFAVATGLLAFLSANIFLKHITDFSRNISADIFSTVAAFSIRAKKFFDRDAEHQRLSLENEKLFIRAVEVELLKKENSELKSALGFKEAYTQDVVPVSSVGLFRLFGNEILMINRGLESGIRTGDVVFTDGKIYVGRALSVKEGASDILLVSSRSEIVDVILSGSGLRARARGLSGGEFAVDFVPNESGINKGEFLWYLPKTPREPADLILGEVRDVFPTTNGVFMNIRAMHLFNPFQPAPLFVALLSTRK